MYEDKYNIKIIMRDGGGQTYDDYHATVTRISDGTQLIWVSRWRWFLNWQLKLKRIDRAFNRSDKYQKKLAHEEEFTL